MELIYNYDYTWSDFVGNIGVAILLVTYMLNVSGKISAQGLVYNLLNLIVAILLTINLIYKPNISALVLEFFWALIAIYGLANFYKTKYNKV